MNCYHNKERLKQGRLRMYAGFDRSGGQGKVSESRHQGIYGTSYGGGFAALWRYPDRSSPAQLSGIPCPWLSCAWRVLKVEHTSRYDIKSWQPFHCARTCKDNLVTSMTRFG